MSAPRVRRRAVASVPLVLALALPAVCVAAAPAASSGRCGQGGTLSDAGNDWLAMQPSFTSASGSQVTAFASPPFDPNLVWATNGTEVARTVDAGCTWTTVYTATAGGLPLAEARITAMAAPSSANQSSFLYLGVTATVAGVAQPQIVVTTDRGQTWSTTSGTGQSGLPIVGTVEDVTANAQVPQIAYALVDTGVAGVSQPAVYATSDAGTTWTRRTANSATADATALRAHPLQTSTLFGLAGHRLDLSSDGGTTFQSVGSLPASITGFDIAAGSGGARIVAALADSDAVALSRDNGNSWVTFAAPAQLTSAAVAPLQDLVVGTDGGQMWFVQPALWSPPIGPKGSSPGALTVSAPTSVGFSVTGLRNGSILRASYSGLVPVPPPIVDGQPVPVYLLPPGPVTQFPATLTPGTTALRLAVGGHVRVPYRLLLPRTPTPVDVMFLVDTTSSMQPVIDGLSRAIAQIATSLDTSGLSARFGLGDFRDYPSPWGSAEPGDWPYRLDHRISIAGPGLAKALSDMQASGGTTDGGQSALTALYQSTTGAGDLEDGETFVAPGQQAGYRPDALKLAMIATDTQPHYGGEPVQNLENPSQTVNDPGPGYDDVITAMRARGIHEIGLAIDPGTTPNSRPALTRLAGATGSFAPAGGVDCNGDGVIDVPAGAPLVCTVGNEGTGAEGIGTGGTVTAASMAAAVISLAANIPDIRPLRLQVRRGAPYASVPAGARRVNLHADNELAYGVEIQCPARSAGRHPIELSAATPARTVATAAIDLTCVGQSALPATGTALTPIAALAIAPAPPAPVTNPVPNANPNPNPNPNPAPNLNLNPAIADQQQQQAQLAFANAEGMPESEQLAMSFAVATIMLAGASCAVVRRRRTGYALCRSMSM